MGKREMSGTADSGGNTVLVVWQEFVRRFPTEEDCLEELARIAGLDGNCHCRHCGVRLPKRLYGARALRCYQCKRKNWLTARTLFHHMQLARAWLGAIWLFERGLTVSAFHFHKLAGIAYSTAWNIFRKLAMVINDNLKESAGHNITSSLFRPVMNRRSRQTPAGGHPSAEQDVFDCTAPQTHQTNTAPEAEMSSEQMSMYQLLTGPPVHFDFLCQQSGLLAGRVSSILMMLELDGHIIRQPGDFYRAIESGGNKEAGPVTKACLSDIFSFIRQHFQGISRKYLQHYVALYACTKVRHRWSPEALMRACLSSKPIRYCDTLSYITPALVWLPA